MITATVATRSKNLDTSISTACHLPRGHSFFVRKLRVTSCLDVIIDLLGDDVDLPIKTYHALMIYRLAVLRHRHRRAFLN